MTEYAITACRSPDWDDAEAKRFFGELAEWEAGHHQALLRQQEELKEDYWSANGFTAF